jgi:hypothetical protein
MKTRLSCKCASKPSEPLDKDETLDEDPTVYVNRCMHQGLVKKIYEMVRGFKCQIYIYSWILIQRIRRLTYILVITIMPGIHLYPLVEHDQLWSPHQLL